MVNIIKKFDDSSFSESKVKIVGKRSFALTQNRGLKSPPRIRLVQCL